MSSLEKRLKSFKNWTLASYTVTPKTLAIAGFVNQPSTNSCTKCYICDKQLEGWEDTDSPFDEHYSHNKKCPLYNLHLLTSRLATFKEWTGPISTQVLARNGFFLYQIKESVNNDIFCFKCGFRIIEFSNLPGHDCEFKSMTVRKFDPTHRLFYISLLKGKYTKMLIEYINGEILVPISYHSDFQHLNKFINGKECLGTTREALASGLKRMLESINEEFEKEKNKVLKTLTLKINKKALK
ncbi:Baculoviral IAP repeat-containing protein 5.2-A [Astathelohania contejeani]|uniref:Baculoviral IAP repeat-containing protein 5.2-A n=1 Tax=Astathelohania contejeani TaxID=164912 RepID=A0ABQ7I2J9_9MICR|nr:Baculoviral IAP repeat-containing protein 5.2-A [Thelohania contejeani]